MITPLLRKKDFVKQEQGIPGHTLVANTSGEHWTVERNSDGASAAHCIPQRHLCSADGITHYHIISLPSLLSSSSSETTRPGKHIESKKTKVYIYSFTSQVLLSRSRRTLVLQIWIDRVLPFSTLLQSSSAIDKSARFCLRTITVYTPTSPSPPLSPSLITTAPALFHLLSFRITIKSFAIKGAIHYPLRCSQLAW